MFRPNRFLYKFISSKFSLLIFILLRLFSCTTTTNAQQNTQNDPVNYVNPFIGTQRMGHTFPGATVPFGMVQLSPDTDTVTYEKKREIQS